MGLEPATAASSAPMALSFNTTADVIAWLPPAGADRLRALRQHFHDLRAVKDRLAANAKAEGREQRLKRLTDHPHRGGFGLKDTTRAS